ncbi:hypothetical protein [Sulfolobus acidocaldarius]|uniref:hypothetical protein n=1 Tax=Sulfolobus acidocaldarius TaxID=2285 RepID=UPI000A6C8FAC|nr:hypothetical protein [Sulfolobus acidocaldarius]
MRLLVVTTIQILSQLALSNQITQGSTGDPIPTINTQNVTAVVITNWLPYNASNKYILSADQVSVYFGNGIKLLDGQVLLPVFVVNYGRVAASGGCWYEDDGGLSDPNGPTMVQYINITNQPSNTFIYEVSPNNYWEYNVTGTTSQSTQLSLSLNVMNEAGVSLTSGVSETFYIYNIVGQTYLPTGTNPNYVEGWKWALNQPGTNSEAQTDWKWPTNTIILTPAMQSTNGYYNAYPINFVAMTIGNFWDSCYPWSTQSVGAGWTIYLGGG